MKVTSVVPILLSALVLAEPAFADSDGSTVRRIFIMWFPMLLILGLWVYFIRKAGGMGRQRQLIERSFVHMDQLEAKLDKLIELLERQPPR